MYKKGIILNKTLVIGIIIFFVATNSFHNIGANSIASVSLDDGSLSGYVNDTSGNPIEGALVRVYFHETYREDYSDSDGYYHVTNISICWCIKNVSCSKEGYKTEWVMLSIAENTNYDFVLTSGNQPPSAPMVDGPSVGRPGEEYCITIWSRDPEGDDVYYYIDWGDGEYEYWFGPFDPGENVTRCHTYPPATKLYEIGVGAKDIYGAESDWGSIYVFILKGRMRDNSFFIRLLERFPMLERILSLFLITFK